MGVVIGIVICEDGGSVVFWLVVYVVDVDVEVVFDLGIVEFGMYGVVMVVVLNLFIYIKVWKYLFGIDILFKRKLLKYLI